MKTITEALDLEMVMATPSDGQLWGADDYENGSFTGKSRVSVQGVKSLDGHFAYLCRGFEFYEVKKNIISFQKEMEILLHF